MDIDGADECTISAHAPGGGWLVTAEVKDKVDGRLAMSRREIANWVRNKPGVDADGAIIK